MDNKPSLAAVFAHDLRNALSPARAALELLQRREAGNEALQPALRTMDRSFTAALETVERFVDAQRIMDGTVKLSIVPLELSGIVARAIELAMPMIAERGQRVVTTLGASDGVIRADASRVTQVLTQLVENAGAASPDGATIELETRVNGERIDIVVREPAPREEGFDSDEALEAMRSPPRTQGLALATARRLVTLQGGVLEARAHAQSGIAEFVMAMPRASLDEIETTAERSAPEVDTPAPTRNARSPQRILLVDDNQAVRNIYREALEELGYDVTLAANGEDALRAAEGSVPEVALIDVHLPTLNGYQLARALRARHPSSDIKLVLLSGMTLDDDMVRLSKNAGFDHCIDKSAGPKAVDALLRQ